jgi:hypothetical protein
MHHHDEPCALCEQDLRTIAIAVGVLPPDAEMTPELLEYTRTVVGRCASIGDGYTDEDGSAGEEIRAAFGLG